MVDAGSINLRALQGDAQKQGIKGDIAMNINRTARKEELGIIPNCPLSSQPNPSNRMSGGRN
jgi:hypothetical protein